LFSQTTDLYDTIYSAFKDYAGEGQQIAALLRRMHPHARTLLDVGCGTGEHARVLRENHAFHVDGIDLDPGMVAIAGAKNPGARFTVADMVEFDLGRQYDAILCLFSAIAYVRSLDNVVRTLDSLRRHMAPGAVLIVEPWFAPGVLEPGRIHVHTAETATVKVCRFSRSTIIDRISRLEFEYLIGDAAGIRRAAEVHELGLFTPQEMVAAFDSAGIDVEHDEVGISGRGLFIGQLRASPPSSSASRGESPERPVKP